MLLRNHGVMYTTELTLEDVYDRCLMNGYLLVLEVIDKKKVENMLAVAKEFSESAAAAKPRINSAFRLYYDSVKTYSLACLFFDKTFSTDDKSIFAALCVKHPELEFDWNFFEKIRLKTDAIIGGENISLQDFKEFELVVNLYINVLKKEIEKKLAE